MDKNTAQLLKIALQKVKADAMGDWLDRSSFGICHHLANRFASSEDELLLAYSFVEHHCVGWNGIVEPTEYPIPIPPRAYLWQGDQLAARLSLIDHLLGKLDEIIDTAKGD